MTVDVNKGFANNDSLRSIREDLLNPIAVRVADLRRDMGEVKPLAKSAFISADKNLDHKTITLHSDSGDSIINLDGMFREGSDLALVDKSGNKIPDISEISFHDSTITNQGTGKADISYDWDKLVPAHQDKMAVGKFGQPATQTPKTLIFRGPSTSVDHSGDTTTVTIPEGASIKGAIGTGTTQAIETINLVGNTSSSSLSGTTLQIHIPDGGGGGITNQNFKGFFETLGDIESEVTDAISGKSYAFAKDSKLGGNYYTPYFYVSNSWTELKQDPALTYSAPTESQTHGVFSIKPDDRIKVDALGQIDLSGLSTPTDVNFHGFYPTIAELKKAIKNPVLNRSFGYVQHISGIWVGVVYRGPTDDWKPVAPVGTIMLQNTDTSGGELFTPISGFTQNGMITIDSKGLATIKPSPDKEVQVDIVDSKGAVTTLDLKRISFVNGSRYVEKDTTDEHHLLVMPSQQAHSFTARPDEQFDPNEYEAAILYDNTTQTWMGCSGKTLPNGQHWSRIIHENMSDEVKSISSRFPEQIKEFVPGVLGDGAAWRSTGWTYVQQDDVQLPEEFRDNAGAYFLTLVQDSDVAIPLQRLQYCYADDDTGRFYFRQFDSTGSPGAAQGWKKWTKGSINVQDLQDHNEDPGAHSLHHKFYKVTTLDMSWKAIKGKNGVIGDNDLLLLSDSHGVSNTGEDKITVPYTGGFRFSGRIDFDGWGTGSTWQRPQFFIYVYKTVGSTSTIVSEFSYNHTDQNKVPPPLQWKSGEVKLNRGDKIHFEMKVFNANLETSYPELRFVPNRTFFVMEDYRTAAGTRIAETYRRTMGSLNAHYNVGVNVHYASGEAGAIRVYGGAVTAQATNMNKITR